MIYSLSNVQNCCTFWQVFSFPRQRISSIWMKKILSSNSYLHIENNLYFTYCPGYLLMILHYWQKSARKPAVTDKNPLVLSDEQAAINFKQGGSSHGKDPKPRPSY